MKYRADIDGLRAIAVLSVLFFHANIPPFKGGFIGVYIFFVISGFLITSIIVEDIQNKKFSLLYFYERRVRRIMPALFLVMAFSTLVAWLGMMPSHFKEFSQSLFATSIFLSNVFFWRDSGYFNTASELKPLLHTWSLAIEEQYYVIFPLFMLVVWKWHQKLGVFLLITTTVICLVLSQLALNIDKNAAFYLLPFRVWELTIGAMVALIHRKQFVDLNDKILNLLSLSGLLLIIVPVFFYTKTTPFPGLYAIPPVLGAAMLIIFCKNNTLAFKVLSQKLFLGIGLISYSLYLWHQPLLAFRHFYAPGENGLGIALGLLAVSFLFAFLSWRFVEQRFRDKKKVSRSRLLLIVLPLWTFFAVFGLWGHISSGFANRQPPNNMHQDAFKIIQNEGISNVGINGEVCEAEYNTRCVRNQVSGPADQNGRMLLLGDSHSGDFEKPLTLFARKNNLNFWQVSIGGCGFIPMHHQQHRGDCGAAIKETLAFIKQENVDIVVIAINMAHYYKGLDQKTASKQTEAFIEYINQISKSGGRIIYITPRDYFTQDPNFHRYANQACSIQAFEQSKLYQDLEERLKSLLWQNNGVVFEQRLILRRLFSEEECSQGYWNKKPLYSDTNHLTEFGGDIMFQNGLEDLLMQLFQLDNN